MYWKIQKKNVIKEKRIKINANAIPELWQSTVSLCTHSFIDWLNGWFVCYLACCFGCQLQAGVNSAQRVCIETRKNWAQAVSARRVVRHPHCRTTARLWCISPVILVARCERQHIGLSLSLYVYHTYTALLR